MEAAFSLGILDIFSGLSNRTIETYAARFLIQSNNQCQLIKLQMSILIQIR